MTDFLALVVQQSVNGVYLGCLYVMVALGLTLIYGVLNQINFAHADFVTVGAFTAFFTATRLATRMLGMPDTAGYLVSLVAALGAGADESTFAGGAAALPVDAAYFAGDDLPAQSPFVAACSVGHVAGGPDGDQAVYDEGYAAERAFQSAWLTDRLALV